MADANQCDGCSSGMSLHEGKHYDRHGFAIMSCQAHKYAATTPADAARVVPTCWDSWGSEGGVTAYYNEIDAFAAQWLRNLIAAGHIAPGIVDERSIEDVKIDQGWKADSACGQAAYGMSGKEPTPWLAIACWPLCGVAQIARALGGAQSQSRDIPRRTHSTEVPLGSIDKSVCFANQAEVYASFWRDISLPFLGVAHGMSLLTAHYLRACTRQSKSICCAAQVQSETRFGKRGIYDRQTKALVGSSFATSLCSVSSSIFCANEHLPFLGHIQRNEAANFPLANSIY